MMIKDGGRASQTTKLNTIQEMQPQYSNRLSMEQLNLENINCYCHSSVRLEM